VLLFGQMALVTPIILGLLGLGLWRLRLAESGGPRLLVWVTVLPAIIFIEHIVSGRVQANWPAVIYPTACLAAAALPEAIILAWARPALGLGFGMTLVAYAQALAAPFPVPAAYNPAALQLAGWQALAVQAAAGKPAFVTADDYATVAELAYYAPPGTAVAGLGARWQYLGMAPAAEFVGETGIMLTRHKDTRCLEQVGTITRNRGDEVIGTYRLCRIVAPAGTVRLP